MKKQSKRYPRGKIFTAKWTGIIENIDLGEKGILYNLENKDETVFMPYHMVQRIEYETIPKELRDVKEDDSTERPTTDSSV